MRRKKGQGDMMQEAIDKASQLITLLQKENKDVKKRLDSCEHQCQMLKRQNSSFKSMNQELREKISFFQDKYVNSQRQLEENSEAFQSLEDSLKKKIHTNKELHQKIALLTGKLKEKTKQLNQQKMQMLSLQNENEYLLKKFEENEEKENRSTRRYNSCNSERQFQLKEAIRLKQAFSRRCQELKADNQALIAAAAEYKQQMLDQTISTEPNVSKIKHVRRTSGSIPKPVAPIVVEPIVPQPVVIPPPIVTDTLISKLLKQKLGVDPVSTIEGQYDQLSTFLEYRLAHLDRLWEGIASKLNSKELLKIENLRDLHDASQRILAYVGQLVSPSV